MLKSFFTFVLISVLSCSVALANNSSNEESAQDSFATLANQPNSMSKTSAAPSFGGSEHDNVLVQTVAPEPNIEFSLSSPVGSSPKVFTKGWSFNARCMVDGKDLSEDVIWTGTGTFLPKQGRTSFPIFKKEGANSITLTIFVNERPKSRTYQVLTVSPSNYAHIGSFAVCSADAHGCPTCPHNVKGPITTGSSKVLINKLAAARVGDVGRHAACCYLNAFTITSGDQQVLIEGRPAARIGDKTKHCGGMGYIVADESRSIVGSWTYFMSIRLSGGMPTLNKKFPVTFNSNGTFEFDGKSSNSSWTLTGNTLKITDPDKVNQYKLSADGNTLTDFQTGELRMQRGSPQK